jgi:hypothetical protein
MLVGDSEAKKLIHVGCHFTVGPSWENFDASPTLRFEQLPLIGRLYTKNERRFPKEVRFGNIVTSLLCDAGTADAVYASHMIEHASLTDFRTVLRNVNNMLRDGGCFRLVTPDLEFMINKYVNSTDPERGNVFIRETGMGLETSTAPLLSRIKRVLGFSHHFWLYDEQTLKTELENAGFQRVRRCYFGDSQMDEFVEIENAFQFENNLGMECFK